MSDLSYKIGDLCLPNPLILAPLAGVTNPPFRLLVKEQGAGLTVTEMVSAVGLVMGGEKTWKLLDTEAWERPLAVQLFGKDPEKLAEGAILAQEAGADLIDFNMGCPARKVVRHGSGAALLKDFKLIRAILKAMRRVIRVPLTVKTRAGWRPGQGEILDLAPVLADCGVDAVTLHGRYAKQGFSGKADWDLVARLVEHFQGPVIGNGDITRPAQAAARLKSTGCAAVMIGRGALGNPWLFRQSLDLLQGRTPREPDLTERFQVAVTHARRLKALVGDVRAVNMLRSILMWYTKGLTGSAAFRRSINQINDFGLLVDLLKDYFASLETRERSQPVYR